MFRNRKRKPGEKATSAARPNSLVEARVIGMTTVSGATLLFARIIRESTPEYCLGIQYDAASRSQTYAGTRDVAAAYRAYMLFVHYLRLDDEPIRRRNAGDYAVDCRVITESRRPKNLDLSREAPVSVTAIRDRLGHELFLLLRDLPVGKMPPAIQKLVQRG